MPNESELPAGRPAETHPTALGSVGPGYEVRDTNVWAIITFAVGLFIVLVVTQVGLWGFLKAITGGPDRAPAPASPYTESVPPAPGSLSPTTKVTPEVVLEISEQRRELNAEEAATLGGYAWAADNTGKAGGPAVARKDRRVRIPIDRAIDLIADRGLRRPGGSPRSEVQVNSHSGDPAPAVEDNKGQPRGRDNDPGASGKGSKK